MKRFLAISLLSFGITVSAAAQQPPATPTPTPTPQAASIPAALEPIPDIAPNYRSDERQLPDLGRVGVDMLQQRSISMLDAIEAALENNRDIEIARKTATIAEFDLAAARGFYQPRLNAQTAYERSTVPNVSIFSNNQTTTQSTLTGNAGIQGFCPPPIPDVL